MCFICFYLYMYTLFTFLSSEYQDFIDRYYGIYIWSERKVIGKVTNQYLHTFGETVCTKVEGNSKSCTECKRILNLVRAAKNRHANGATGDPLNIFNCGQVITYIYIYSYKYY